MIGLIGGTGLGDALFGEAGATAHDVDTPFGRPSAPIHVVEWSGTQVAILSRHGVGHTLNPSRVPYRANIYALKSLGVTHILASGAVGSLDENLRPRNLVLVDQLIDKTTRRTPTFFDDGLAVHVEFAEPFCAGLRKLLIDASEHVDCSVHHTGTYLCMEGPAFSTRAESHMHRMWSAELVGMTLMPEAKLAREAEIAYAMISLVTDYDCWRPHDASLDAQKLLEEIIGNLQQATANAIALMRGAIALIAENGLPDSTAHDALKLGIWTNRAAITPERYEQYGVLLERYRP